jgi:hypothetical protein
LRERQANPRRRFPFRSRCTYFVESGKSRRCFRMPTIASIAVRLMVLRSYACSSKGLIEGDGCPGGLGHYVHGKTADEDNAETQSSLRSAEKNPNRQMNGASTLGIHFALGLRPERRQLDCRTPKSTACGDYREKAAGLLEWLHLDSRASAREAFDFKPAGVRGLRPALQGKGSRAGAHVLNWWVRRRRWRLDGLARIWIGSRRLRGR